MIRPGKNTVSVLFNSFLLYPKVWTLQAMLLIELLKNLYRILLINLIQRIKMMLGKLRNLVLSKLMSVGRLSDFNMTCRFPQRVNGALVRCRKCLPCQITYRQSWALRIMHEVPYFPSSSFITFTYDDDHLPPSGSLIKSDMQEFFRNLRYDFSTSDLSKTIEDGKLKYYLAGEYGDNSFRPHYHAIIFGLNPQNRQTRELVMDNWNKCDWLSLNLNKAFGSVTMQSAEYVAGYVHKKYFGSYQKKIYQDNGLIPPYSAKSLGIGSRYALKHVQQIIERGYVLVNGSMRPVPKYYYDLLLRNPRKKNLLLNDSLNRFYDELLERNQFTFNEQCGMISNAERISYDAETIYRRGKGQHS